MHPPPCQAQSAPRTAHRVIYPILVGLCFGVSPDPTLSQDKVFLWKESGLMSVLPARFCADLLHCPIFQDSSLISNNSCHLQTYSPWLCPFASDPEEHRDIPNVSGAGIWITIKLCLLPQYHRVSLRDSNWIWRACFSVGLCYKRDGDTYKRIDLDWRIFQGMHVITNIQNVWCCTHSSDIPTLIVYASVPLPVWGVLRRFFSITIPIKWLWRTASVN